MRFPADMTVEEIEQFDYEYNRIRDIEEGIGDLREENKDE